MKFVDSESISILFLYLHASKCFLFLSVERLLRLWLRRVPRRRLLHGSPHRHLLLQRCRRRRHRNRLQDEDWVHHRRHRILAWIQAQGHRRLKCMEEETCLWFLKCQNKWVIDCWRKQHRTYLFSLSSLNCTGKGAPIFHIRGTSLQIGRWCLKLIVIWVPHLFCPDS